MSSLVWFRADLRLQDNPALIAACRRGEPVQAIYCHCPVQRCEHGHSPRQLDLIERQLNQLGQQLAALGIPLELLECDRFSQLPERIEQWTREKEINALFANHEAGLNEQHRDQQVAERLPLTLFDSDTLIPPGELKTNSGSPYRVFTPYARAWLQQLRLRGLQLQPSPPPQGPALEFQPLQLGGAKRSSSAWPVGEQAAQEQLTRFCREHLLQYGALRDHPAAQATSGLSPYLALGIISVRQCLAEIEHEQGFLPLSRGEAGFDWLNELIWRDFYRHLLYAYPRLSLHQPFREDTDRLPWSHNPEQLQRWQQGQTGFPIIDAAMRCLLETGWMHNRLRMLVASFLTKDLLIDWRLGEDWFMQQLIDADFASNNGGWQWSAGTGADAAPYFRVFSPERQSLRFDAKGAFIRRWLPELRELPDRAIHAPTQWLAEHNQSHRYPLPMVDHSQARRRVIELFQELSQQEAL